MELHKSNALGAEGMCGDRVMITVNPVTFAKRLREARLAAQLTQQQLADACGISDRTVSAWETGLAEGILAANLFSVADYMHVDPRWLATGEGPSAPQPSNQIARDLEQLPPEQQEAVRNLIKSLNR